MVVAQLVERSIPTPEIRGSIPIIENFYTKLNDYKLYLKEENNTEKDAGKDFFDFLFCIKRIRKRDCE